MEKVTLGTQPLHHKHALLTEVAGVAAAQAQGECLSHGFLGPGEKSNVLGLNTTLKARPRDVEILNQITASSGLLAAAYVTCRQEQGQKDTLPTASTPAGALHQVDLNKWTSCLNMSI